VASEFEVDDDDEAPLGDAEFTAVANDRVAASPCALVILRAMLKEAMLGCSFAK
jgi:hypothetical protein